MLNPALSSFGARVASHELTPEEIAWFLKGVPEVSDEAAPPDPPPTEPRRKIQIGPLDV